MKTLKLRIKDKHADQLNQLAGSVNFVWNYVNNLSFKHLQRTGLFFSAYDIALYVKRSGEYLNLHSQTLQAIGVPTIRKPNVSHLVGFLLSRQQ